MMSRQIKLEMIEKVIEKNNLIVGSDEWTYNKTYTFSDGKNSYIFGDVMRVFNQAKKDELKVSFAFGCYYDRNFNSIQFSAWVDMPITEDFIEQANAKIDFIRKNFDDAMKIRNEKIKESKIAEIKNCGTNFEM